MHRLRFVLILASVPAAACRDAVGPEAGAAFTAVAAGDGFTCALDSDARAWCWGQGVFGQLGDSASEIRARPVRVAGGLRFRSIVAGSDHACGVAQDSTAWCWGLNDFGELGSTTSFCNQSIRFVSCADRPRQVSGGLRFDALTVGGYATCGLVRGAPPGSTSGTHSAWCWGWNTHGELGLGTIGDVTDGPARVDGGRGFSAMSLSLYHACGVDGGGLALCWGSNIYGQLGADTASTPRCHSGPANGLFCAPEPIPSAFGQSIASISAGGDHTCAITGSGTAICWGSNQTGALGSPQSSGGATPVGVTGGRQFSSISAGRWHTCALTSGGQAWCWGVNDEAQLGPAAPDALCPAFGSARACNRTPVAVTGIELTRISAGYSHTCGITRRGQLWCWGRGAEGQLGDGRLESSSAPVMVELTNQE